MDLWIAAPVLFIAYAFAWHLGYIKAKREDQQICNRMRANVEQVVIINEENIKNCMKTISIYKKTHIGPEDIEDPTIVHILTSSLLEDKHESK